MNRNTAQLVLLQDFPLLPSCPCFPENQLFQHLFLVSFFFWKKRNKLHSQKKFPVTALSSLCTTAVFFFLFLFHFVSKSSEEGLLNRPWWIGVTGQDPRLASDLSPQLGLDREQWTHTQDGLSTTACKHGLLGKFL